MDKARYDGMRYYGDTDWPEVMSDEILGACDWVSVMWHKHFDHSGEHDWGCERYKAEIEGAKKHLEDVKKEYGKDDCRDNLKKLMAAIYRYARAEHEISSKITDEGEAWALIGERSYIQKHIKITTGGRKRNLFEWGKSNTEGMYVREAIDHSLWAIEVLEQVIIYEPIISSDAYPISISLNENDIDEKKIYLTITSREEVYRLARIAGQVTTAVNTVSAIKEGVTSESRVVQILYDLATRGSAFSAAEKSIVANLK